VTVAPSPLSLPVRRPRPIALHTLHARTRTHLHTPAHLHSPALHTCTLAPSSNHSPATLTAAFAPRTRHDISLPLPTLNHPSIRPVLRHCSPPLLHTPSPHAAARRPAHPRQMAQPWDYIAKIVSLGDSGCGKSSVRVHVPTLIPLVLTLDS
jgi:hypothetical protein